jgi:hypothetical protein
MYDYCAGMQDFTTYNESQEIIIENISVLSKAMPLVVSELLCTYSQWSDFFL